MTSLAINLKASPFSLFVLVARWRFLFPRDSEEEEAKEEVDVTEAGFVFLVFKLAGLVKGGGGAGSLCCFFMAGRSLVRPPSDSGFKQGLRKGDLLSLSLQKTTAIEPPTTELPDPPVVPPDPKRSMLIFPEPSDAPVVLLTPSRNRTETLDCSLLFRLPSFLDLPVCVKPFLQSFFRSFSLPIFLACFAKVRPDEMDAEPDVTISEEMYLPLILEDEEDSAWPIFFNIWGFFFR